MDLSRAFDSLPHVLIVSKLRQYGADERTPSLIKDYLSNRHQRVKLGIETQPGKKFVQGSHRDRYSGPYFSTNLWMT